MYHVVYSGTSSVFLPFKREVSVSLTPIGVTAHQ